MPVSEHYEDRAWLTVAVLDHLGQIGGLGWQILQSISSAELVIETHECLSSPQERKMMHVILIAMTFSWTSFCRADLDGSWDRCFLASQNQPERTEMVICLVIAIPVPQAQHKMSQ